LYKEAKGTSNLNDAKLAAGFTQQSMSDIGGILPAEGTCSEFVARGNALESMTAIPVLML